MLDPVAQEGSTSPAPFSSSSGLAEIEPARMQTNRIQSRSAGADFPVLSFLDQWVLIGGVGAWGVSYRGGSDAHHEE